MDDSFFFPQTCTVTRLLDTPNESGVPRYVSVFSGRCDVQWASGGNMNLAGGVSYQSNPPIFVDSTDVEFRVNDKITVSWENGREMEGLIENLEQSDDADLGGTWIWTMNFKDAE